MLQLQRQTKIPMLNKLKKCLNYDCSFCSITKQGGATDRRRGVENLALEGANLAPRLLPMAPPFLRNQSKLNNF